MFREPVYSFRCGRYLKSDSVVAETPLQRLPPILRITGLLHLFYPGIRTHALHYRGCSLNVSTLLHNKFLSIDSFDNERAICDILTLWNFFYPLYS